MAGVVVCIISWNSEKLNCSTDKAKTIVTLGDCRFIKEKSDWMYEQNEEFMRRDESKI